MVSLPFRLHLTFLFWYLAAANTRKVNVAFCCSHDNIWPFHGEIPHKDKSPSRPRMIQCLFWSNSCLIIITPKPSCGCNYLQREYVECVCVCVSGRFLLHQPELDRDRWLSEWKRHGSCQDCGVSVLRETNECSCTQTEWDKWVLQVSSCTSTTAVSCVGQRGQWLRKLSHVCKVAGSDPNSHQLPLTAWAAPLPTKALFPK